jgi:hypothetical protein
MSPVKLGQRNSSRISSRVLVIGVLALIFALPLMVRASYGASGASISLSYSVKTTGSGTVIAVTVSARDSQFPAYVSVSLASYFNGAASPFNHQVVTVLVSGGGSVSQMFTVPSQGNGNYLFDGKISSTSGNLICEAVIDPFIKSGH